MRFEGQGRITRGGRQAVSPMFLPFLFSLRGAFRLGHEHPLLVSLGTIAVVVLALCDLLWALRKRIRQQAGILSADEEGLQVDGKTVIARREMKAAYLTSSSDTAVRIERHRASSVSLKLQTTHDARALVESLGLGLAHVPLRLAASRGKTSPRAFIMLGLVSSVALGIGGVAMRSMLVVGVDAFVVQAMIIAAIWASMTVVVGTDGLLLGRAFRSEFIPFSLLAGARAEGSRVVLSLRSGKDIRVMPSQVTAETLVGYIEEARALAARTEGAASAAAVLLMPAGRTLGAWAANLRSLASDSTYREVPLGADQLRRVLDDPKAPPPARAGAAAALAGRSDSETRARAEAAARACANPKLRVALSRIAAGADEVEVERALEPLLRESLERTTQ
jgi:hypothetical protein